MSQGRLPGDGESARPGRPCRSAGKRHSSKARIPRMTGRATGPLSGIRYLLFDLDGTLVDTTRLILFTFQETLRTLGLPPRSDMELLLMIGRPLREQAEDIDARRAEEIFRLYQELYDRYHDGLAREFPGIREALAGLRERGYRLALVTSKRLSSAMGDLEYFRLTPYFHAVVTADDTVNHKPQPDPVLKALERLEAPRERSAFVGDSPFDMRSAHAAGVLAGAVGWGPFPRELLEAEKPDFWIPGPSDFLTLFPGVSAE